MIEKHEITNLIDQSYQEEGQDRHPWPLTPSAFGHCERQLALLLSGMAPAPLSGQQRRIFEVGHQRGEVLARRLSEALSPQEADTEGAFIYLEREIWVPTGIFGGEAHVILTKADRQWIRDAELPLAVVNDELHILGHSDFFMDHGDRTATLIDFKTAGSYAYGKLQDEGPSEGYIIQLLAYEAAELAAGDFDSISTYLVYEAKDSDARKGHLGGELKVVPVWGDKAYRSFENGMDKVRRLLRAYLKGPGALMMTKEPYVIGGKSGRAKALPWNCNYCSIGPSLGVCWGGQVTDKGKGTNRRRWVLSTGDEQ